MTLNDFQPDQILEREAEKAEDLKIMDLLGRFTAEMLKDALIENGGHPKPEWGDGETWRFYYIEECSRRGTRLLEELGWPTDEDALYVNLHTGCVERLIDVVTSNGYFADRHTISNQVWTIIEHWQPYDQSLPNEFRIKYLEENLERLYQLKSREKKDAYVKSDIKKIPEVEKELAKEKAKRKGENNVQKM